MIFQFRLEICEVYFLKYLKRIFVFVLLVGICFSALPQYATYGWDFIEEIEKANNFLKDKYGYNDYYKLTCSYGNIANQYVTNGHGAFYNYPLMLYGTAQEATDSYFEGKGSSSPAGKYSNKNKEYRALGFTREGCPFPNPWFPPDYSGNFTNNNDSILVPKVPIKLDTETSDSDRCWIKEPYDVRSGYKVQLSRNLPGVGNSIYINDGTANMIKSWVRTDSFTPDRILERFGDRAYYANLVVNPPVSIKDNLEDYIAVLSPPTDRSWGIGIGFYYIRTGGTLASRYSLFYLMPTELAAKQDILSASFSNLPGKYADAGKELAIGINIKTNSEEDLEGVDYKLEVTRVKDGKPLAIEIKGNKIYPLKQKIDIPQTIGNRFYVCFEMPEDSGVNIRFVINENGTNPVETYLINNRIETTINVPLPPTIQAFDLDYNVLSRRITYPLYNQPITATLPSGYSWTGNATGSLDVENQSENLLRDFNVTNNPRINEPSTIITREPQIHATLTRPDFGDDPQNKKWSNWNDPYTPVGREGIVTFDGTVSRPYEYYCGFEDCEECPHDDTATAEFEPGRNITNARAFIYNGKATIEPKVYSNRIDYSDSAKEINLLWTSKPYNFNVVRWMYHMDENGNLINPTLVDGRYQRTFTQQDSGKFNWSIPSSMEANYKRSREAARRGDKSSSERDIAVFASDKAYQKTAYPIRSGYYFNPTGTYQFTVETVTYKPTTADTEEHRNLVQALINSFRYESDLVYVNNKNQAVDIQNQPASKSGTVYVARSAAITAADPIGLDGVKWLEVRDRSTDSSRYRKTVEQINHSTDVDGSNTHEFWKNVLEGYRESGTLSSFNNFKYREYVKPGQTMYRITERTTVTIIVNPQNVKAYTHIQMANGKYNVRAYFDETALKNISSALPNIKRFQIDGIEISVVGSRYDDMGYNED